MRHYFIFADISSVLCNDLHIVNTISWDIRSDYKRDKSIINRDEQYLCIYISPENMYPSKSDAKDHDLWP